MIVIVRIAAFWCGSGRSPVEAIQLRECFIVAGRGDRDRDQRRDPACVAYLRDVVAVGQAHTRAESPWPVTAARTRPARHLGCAGGSERNGSRAGGLAAAAR